MPKPIVPFAADRPTLTVKETAVALGLSEDTTRLGIARAEIPSIRVSGRVLVPTAALRRMLAMDADAGPTAAA